MVENVWQEERYGAGHQIFHLLILDQSHEFSRHNFKVQWHIYILALKNFEGQQPKAFALAELNTENHLRPPGDPSLSKVGEGESFQSPFLSPAFEEIESNRDTIDKAYTQRSNYVIIFWVQLWVMLKRNWLLLVCPFLGPQRCNKIYSCALVDFIHVVLRSRFQAA
jgi:hypothetical protein